MKIEESKNKNLIEILEKLPPDAKVVVCGYEGVRFADFATDVYIQDGNIIIDQQEEYGKVRIGD